MKLFKVSFFHDYSNEIFIVANDYNDAAEKALEITREDDSILDRDGSLKEPNNHVVKTVELLTENLEGIKK